MSEIARLAPADHAGVVVMHGTDTMEEAAHFINECLPSTPVALCGAMRPPGTPGYDGGRNLLDAITVARDPHGPELGTVVVMNHEVLPAWDVVKRDSVALSSFATRHGTRIGTVHDRQLRLLSRPLEFNWLGAIPPVAPDPDGVAYVRLSGSPGRRLFAQAISGARGIVDRRARRRIGSGRGARRPARGGPIGAAGPDDAHRIGAGAGGGLLPARLG